MAMEIGLFGLVGSLAVVAIAELVLRLVYGVGNPPLYVADARTGYRLAPSQSLRRRGNHMAINQYSMRGPAIAVQPASHTLRVLMLGDSVVNGGWWTDQSQLLSVRVQAALSEQLSAQGQEVEVLNASANSWGPRHELGYVLKFGTFGAQIVLMVLNTDDLFAIAPNAYDLGRHPAYPTRRPLLALGELVTKIKPYRPSPRLQALYDQPGDRVGVNLEAIRQLHQTVKAAQGRLLLAMTPLKRELGQAGPQDYERVARQRLKDLTQAQAIPYLDFLPQLQSLEADPLYRDHIHLNPAGYHWVGQQLGQFIATAGTPSMPETSARIEPAAMEDVLGDLW